MTSKTFNRPGPISYDINPSPETMYHFPSSPGEPGKFDFYRVHLANHAYHSDSVLSDTSDVPVLSTTSSSQPVEKRRWTPFADLVSFDSSKTNSSVLSNTNGKKPIENNSSLTNTVTNALNNGLLNVPTKTIRRPISGTTLSSKDLNHLSPQSM